MHQKEIRDLMSEARPEIGSPPPRKREGIGRWRWVAVVVALATAQLALPQYFVDCTLGSNGIGTSGSPWNTLASVPALGSNATLSIKRGCACDGRITVGAGAENVSIDAYGTGDSPVVYGSKLIALNEWVAEGSGLYRYDLPNWGDDKVNGVFASTGERLPLGRFPNTSTDESAAWLRNELYTRPVGSGSTTITATTSSPAPPADPTGAELVMRTSNHELRKTTVTAYSSGVYTISSSMGDFAGSLEYDATDNAFYNHYDWGFFIQNHPSLLDAINEWCYMPAIGNEPAHILLFTGGSSAPEGVRVSVEKYGVEVNYTTSPTQSTADIRIADLEFRQQNEIGVGIRWGAGANPTTSVQVEDCYFNQMLKAINDALPSGTSQHQFINNRMEDCLQHGIVSYGSGVTCTGNALSRIGMDPSYYTGFGDGIALAVAGGGVTIDENLIKDVGYAGIATGGGGFVRRNYVSNAMAMLNDGSNITFDGVDGMEVSRNILMDPNTDGVNLQGVARLRSDNGSRYADRVPIANGIYYGDKFHRNTLVEGNVAANCDKGIHVDHSQCAENAVVTGNTLFNNRHGLSMTDASCYMPNATITNQIGYDPGCGHPNSGNVINPQLACSGTQNSNYVGGFSDTYSGNIVYCLKPEQICVYQGHVYPHNEAALVDFGDFTNNRYFNPFNKVTHLQQLYYCVSGVTEYLGFNERAMPWTLSSWQSIAQPGQDASSGTSPLRLPRHQIAQVVATSIAPHTDECNSSTSPFSTSSSWIDGTTEDFRRFTDSEFIEMWNTAGMADIDDSDDPETPDIFEFVFRIRAQGIDALQLGPEWQPTNENGVFPGEYRAPYGYVGLTEDWQELRVAVEVDDITSNDKLITAFQNVQQSLGAISTSVVELDYVRVNRIELDAAYEAEIAANHILRYHCPLPGTEGDTRNVAATSGILTVPGITGQCWSDVHGNFYAAGDEIALAEWASIVLFRFDVPTSALTFTNGVYTVSGSELWTTHQNIAGSVVVPSGATLTIDGAHIGFANSTQNLTTNITVEPGGNLILRNGATLRNWMGCGEPPIMWDGVKALGRGTTDGAGLVVMESGARITDAYTAIRCAEGEPGTIFGGDADAGGIVQATDAIFENNEYDVVTRPHTIVDPNAWGPSSFTRCTFRRTRALHDATAEPGAHVSLMQSSPTEFIGCTLENTSGLAPTDPGEWGFGIHAINARIRVVRDEVADKRGSFKGLSAGILHSAYEPTAIALIDECDFSGNGRGLLFWGTDNSNVTRCTFSVADVQVEDLSVEGAYGAYLYGCSGFEVEENSFTGPDGAQPTVGLVLRDCMQDDNMFYNNTFNGFADPTGSSAGTIIMGNNANADQSVGLRIKCNDYSATATNDYDLAFTGSTVNIANDQGTGVDATAPAGNTFANVDALTCDGNEERHFFVEDAMNTFTYWHHEPQTAVELVPHCSNAPNANSNSLWFYDKPEACPVDLSGLIPIEDDDETAEDAHAEHDVLVEVYDDWTDGGSTEGLIQYILNSGNDSYAVRNKLMLVAPSVTIDGWRAALITRTPAMNPWHLAQALLANSPLQQEVLDMVESLPIEPFYKELVYGGQSGVSMHTIYQSEIAHFYAAKTTALQAMVRKSLLSGDAGDIALTHARLTASKGVGEKEAHLALYLVEGDLTNARTLVDAQLQGGGDLGYWQVQDLLLSLKEQSMGPQDLDGNGEQTLRDIVAAQGQGAAQAQAWLALLGHPEPEVVILPANSKRRKPVRERTTQGVQPVLAAYPNPSNGPVYLVYQVPEGVEQAEVLVSDAQGRLVKRERIAPKDGILEILPKELAAGVHIAALYFDGIQVGTAKLNLMR